MSDKSRIEWTDASWNPLRARSKTTNRIGWFCTHASEGCRHCYAETINIRLGNGLHYVAPNREMIEWQLTGLDTPSRWKRPRRIFVNSMTDLFHEDVPEDFIFQVFEVMCKAYWHTFQILTKRAARMQAILESWCDTPKTRENVAPNVWLGVSVEDQKTANERILDLLRTPAAVRWVSYEPALGPVDFTSYLQAVEKVVGIGSATGSFTKPLLPGLDWIVVGGESGPGARPFDIQWALQTIYQCRDSGVPCFVKQLGYKAYDSAIDVLNPVGNPDVGTFLHFRHSKAGEMNEWDEDLRVREYPR